MEFPCPKYVTICRDFDAAEITFWIMVNLYTCMKYHLFYTFYTEEVSYSWLFLGFFQPRDKRESICEVAEREQAQPRAGPGRAAPPTASLPPSLRRDTAPSAGRAAKQSGRTAPSALAGNEPALRVSYSSGLPSAPTEIAYGVSELRPSRKLALQKGLREMSRRTKKKQKKAWLPFFLAEQKKWKSMKAPRCWAVVSSFGLKGLLVV